MGEIPFWSLLIELSSPKITWLCSITKAFDVTAQIQDNVLYTHLSLHTHVYTTGLSHGFELQHSRLDPQYPIAIT